MNPNTLNLLSIARKGGMAALGEDAVGSAARAGHARLIAVASDASDHTYRRTSNFARTAGCPLVRLDISKQELGFSLGRSTCAMIALTDPGLALSFGKALGTLAESELALLVQFEAKQRKLRQEAKAHKTNLKHRKK